MTEYCGNELFIRSSFGLLLDSKPRISIIVVAYCYVMWLMNVCNDHRKLPVCMFSLRCLPDLKEFENDSKQHAFKILTGSCIYSPRIRLFVNMCVMRIVAIQVS